MGQGQRIEFSRTLYGDAAVQAAVEAYGHLATLKVSESDDSIVVEITNPDERVADRLVDALCNHALYETVSRSRAAQEVSP